MIFFSAGAARCSSAFLDGHDAHAQREHGTKVGPGRRLRGAVRGLGEVLDLALPAERGAAIDAMDVPALQALYDHIKQKRRWP